MSADNPGFRLSILGVVALSLFAALFARLYFLQVLEKQDLAQEVTANRIRVVHEPAPRGRILDRDQNVLVDSRQVVQVTMDLRKLEEATGSDVDAKREVYDRLADELAMSEPPVLNEDGGPMTGEDVEAALEANLVDVFAPVPVATDVPESLEVALLERSEDLPGVGVRRTAVREYPYGSLAAHVLGYVGSISLENLEELEGSPLDYEPGDEIGRTGVELAYENDLRGQPGQTTYEVDAEGNVVRTIRPGTFPPERGHDVILTLDVNVQAVAEQALADELAGSEGSVVVLEPTSGAVVAMASNPTFNPSDFTSGISQETYAELTNPVNGLPLNNRVIQGQYAPGSTFKPITAIAALRNDVYTPADTFEDPGFYVAQGCAGEDESCRFENDESTPHSGVDLPRSLTVSSDFYYYQIGDILWLRRDENGDEALQEVAVEFGLGDETGVELPSELEGLVSTPTLKAERHAENPDAFPYGDWRSGDNINFAIGQGDLLVTPLQLANAYGALANGGTLWRPHLASAVVDPHEDSLTVVEDFDPEEIGEVDLPAEMRDPIIQGLLGVTAAGDGTAVSAFAENPSGWPVAGKTGTAQVAGKLSTSVFAGWGPVLPDQPPQYVAAAVLEESGYGADAAAPVVARIFRGLADPSQLPAAPRADQVLGDPDAVDPSEQALG